MCYKLGFFFQVFEFELFIAISTDARIKQEVHEEPAVKMQKTDHVAQRRISQHKNSPVPKLAPHSNLPFPGQHSANVRQNPLFKNTSTKPLNSPTKSTITPPLMNYRPPRKVEPATLDSLPGSK